MSKAVFYDVYDGDRLFLERVTRQQLSLIFNCPVTTLMRHIMRDVKLRDRYTIVESPNCDHEEIPEEIGTVEPKDNLTSVSSEWAKEWDRVRLAIQGRVEWVSQGGRKLTTRGK